MASKPQQMVDFASLFARAAEAGAFVAEALIEKLSKMLSIAEELDANKPMHLMELILLLRWSSGSGSRGNYMLTLPSLTYWGQQQLLR